jgi:hypothetical protein
MGVILLAVVGNVGDGGVGVGIGVATALLLRVLVGVML